MNILFINSIQMFGGGEIWMLRTLEGLRKRGHHMHLICRPGTELERRARALGIHVYCFQIRGDYGPLSIYRTWRYIRQHQIEIVLTNMDKELRFGGMAARMAGHVVVLPRRGIDYPLKNKPHYRFAYNILADGVIANSLATKNAVLRNAPWLSPDRVNVIYNGIEPERFMTPPERNMRAEWGIPADDYVFGFVGQLDERKGLHTLLPAFRDLKSGRKAHLVLVGQGRMIDEIEAFVTRHGLEDRVHRVGFEKDVENVMKAIDCLVLPSLWEGFGIVLIEAMAAGKPCITTQVSSMPEIVEHERTGLVVPVQDETALGQAMTSMLDNPETAKSWGDAGRQRVIDHFTLDQMLTNLETLFTDKLKTK